MKNLPRLAVCSLALLLAACSSSTPAGRIEKNPQIYHALSADDQEKVSRGQVDQGMSPGAVYLAWGDPDRRIEGQAGSVRTMRWDFTSMRPVYTTDIFGYYGFGHYGRRGYYNRGFGFSPSVEYVPMRSASVFFENDRVKSWERIR